MSEGNGDALPAGWTIATIEELIGFGGVFNDGDWVESEDQDPSGDVRLIQLADVGDGQYRDRSNRFLTSIKAAELRCTLLHPGDLLVARMPDPLGRVCVYPGDSKQSVTVVDVCIIRLESEADSRWLMHQLNTPQARGAIARLQSGTTRKRISRKNLATVAFPVPPLCEQQRIAATVDELLSDLDAGVKALEGVRAKLKQYRAAVLKAAVEGTLTAEWRNAYPETEPADKLLERILTERRRRWEESQLKKFKDAGKAPPKRWKEKYEEPVFLNAEGLPWLPERWRWTTLDSLIVEGPQNGVHYPSKDYGSGTAILRIDDYQNGWMRERDSLKRVAAPAEDVETYGLREGDLVVNRVNSMTHLGKCVEVPRSHAGVLFESNMMRATLASEVARRWVEQYLHSLVGRRRLTRNAKWAVNQASINQEDVKRTPVPLAPLAEQTAIVEAVETQLSVIDHLESDLGAKLKSAAALRQSILKAAFEGKLVPQDPSDEPASELLKRIAAERAERERVAKDTKKAAKRGKAGMAPRRNMSKASSEGKADRA